MRRRRGHEWRQRSVADDGSQSRPEAGRASFIQRAGVAGDVRSRSRTTVGKGYPNGESAEGVPEVGAQVTKDEAFGVVESVKAVSDIYAPVSGTVTEVNVGLPDSPETINEDPYGDAWMIRVEMSDPDELEDLMKATEYKKFVEEEKEEE